MADKFREAILRQILDEPPDCQNPNDQFDGICSENRHKSVWSLTCNSRRVARIRSNRFPFACLPRAGDAFHGERRQQR